MIDQPAQRSRVAVRRDRFDRRGPKATDEHGEAIEEIEVSVGEEPPTPVEGGRDRTVMIEHVAAGRLDAAVGHHVADRGEGLGPDERRRELEHQRNPVGEATDVDHDPQVVLIEIEGRGHVSRPFDEQLHRGRPER